MPAGASRSTGFMIIVESFGPGAVGDESVSLNELCKHASAQSHLPQSWQGHNIILQHLACVHVPSYEQGVSHRLC
jgi:hypothetical protein